MSAFGGKSGHALMHCKCLLMTRSGHKGRFRSRLQGASFSRYAGPSWVSGWQWGDSVGDDNEATRVIKVLGGAATSWPSAAWAHGSQRMPRVSVHGT